MRVVVRGSRRYRHYSLALLPLLPIPLVAVMIGVVVALSMTLALAMAVLAMLVGAAVIVMAFGGFAFASWHLARRAAPWMMGRVAPRELAGGSPRSALVDARRDSPVDVLRRRYAAGEIGQSEFRQRLIGLLKERYVRGDLTIGEFESRVERVLRDPALRSPA